MPKPVTANYWTNFLKSQNLIGVITEETEEEPTTTTARQAPPQLDPDMETFIDRVTTRLIPIHADYTPAVKTSLAANRTRYRQELTALLNGRGTLEKWFNKTRNELGLHAITLTKILHDSLQGLKHKDAKMLQAQFAETLQNMTSMYQVR